ncbi:MAG: tetratricopeptide repeat protein [Tannerellaceae bacterium]|nr:tetratricopeptide repeat protein [Tannerellaceae bacterium]
MRSFIRKVFYITGIILFTSSLFAQSLDQAKKLYNEGKYEEAKPAFEKLVKRTPGNSSYNHWYGVCCFETGDLQTAEKHLLAASKRSVQESFRYLGELYLRTYQFDESANMFRQYISMLSKKKQDVSAFEEKLAIAEKAQRMLDKVEDVQVIDSIVVYKNDFLDAYKLSEESGSLAFFNDFFETPEDVFSTVYMNQKGDNIYYAHPSEDGTYSIYRQSRLIDKWGDEKELPSNINSGSADENFPFVMSDGVTIYYASTGNGSIGGYDLFVTRYNINSETYLTPEQLGMPYNSIYNDYMMVYDEVKHLGWFASDRYQPEDKVCIYLFIPNENRSRLENEEIEVKRARASLESIAVTWKPDTDYSELIRLAYMEIAGEPEIQKDFEFIVNNQIIYYNLEDFQSPEARSYYEKVVNLNREMKDMDEELESLRASYIQANTARKKQLAPSILSLEEKLNTLADQPAPWEKKARNTEINFLRLNR